MDNDASGADRNARMHTEDTDTRNEKTRTRGKGYTL